MSVLNNLKEQINNIDYVNYFKEEFTRTIKILIDNFDINYVFRVLYHSFDLDFYILLISKEEYKKYYKLNNLNKEELQELIIIFINHFVDFYKESINEIYKQYLISNDKYYYKDNFDHNDYDPERIVLFFNFISNEELIENLNKKDNNFDKCNYIKLLFEKIRFNIYTSFINYKEIEFKRYFYDNIKPPDDGDEYNEMMDDLLQTIKNKYKKYIGYKYDFILKFLYHYYSSDDLVGTYGRHLYFDLYINDEIFDFDEKYLNNIPYYDLIYNLLNEDKIENILKNRYDIEIEELFDYYKRELEEYDKNKCNINVWNEKKKKKKE